MTKLTYDYYWPVDWRFLLEQYVVNERKGLRHNIFPIPEDDYWVAQLLMALDDITPSKAMPDASMETKIMLQTLIHGYRQQLEKRLYRERRTA